MEMKVCKIKENCRGGGEVWRTGEKQKERKHEKNEEILLDLWNAVKRTNTCTVGIT